MSLKLPDEVSWSSEFDVASEVIRALHLQNWRGPVDRSFGSASCIDLLKGLVGKAISGNKKTLTSPWLMTNIRQVIDYVNVIRKRIRFGNASCA
jgi:hypothetical protein